MVTRICPHCRTTYAAEDYISDFAHVCQSGQAVLDQDDVLKLDSWTEDPVFGSNGNQANPNLQGAGNQLFGTVAWMEQKLDVDARTVRGSTSATHRQRQHVEFIEGVNQ